jgi:hypothetical protein
VLTRPIGDGACFPLRVILNGCSKMFWNARRAKCSWAKKEGIEERGMLKGVEPDVPSRVPIMWGGSERTCGLAGRLP